MDIIPSDLATYGKDAKSLLKELQSQNERMFMVTFLVLNTGRTEQELENNVFQAQSIAQKHNCNLRRLDFHVTHSGEGEGLLFFGNVILPFVDHFPKDLELYRILTTRLSEVAEAQKHE